MSFAATIIRGVGQAVIHPEYKPYIAGMFEKHNVASGDLRLVKNRPEEARNLFIGCADILDAVAPTDVKAQEILDGVARAQEGYVRLFSPHPLTPEMADALSLLYDAMRDALPKTIPVTPPRVEGESEQLGPYFISKRPVTFGQFVSFSSFMGIVYPGRAVVRVQDDDPVLNVPPPFVQLWIGLLGTLTELDYRLPKQEELLLGIATMLQDDIIRNERRKMGLPNSPKAFDRCRKPVGTHDVYERVQDHEGLVVVGWWDFPNVRQQRGIKKLPGSQEVNTTFRLVRTTPLVPAE